MEKIPPLRKLSAEQAALSVSSGAPKTPIPVPIIIPPSPDPGDACLSEKCRLPGPTIVLTACSQRSGEMTPPQTPPASKLETTVPTFNIISATPTPSVGETRQQTPENNNIQEQSKRDMVVVTTS